jgi:hypothetical protein
MPDSLLEIANWSCGEGQPSWGLADGEHRRGCAARLRRRCWTKRTSVTRRYSYARKRHSTAESVLRCHRDSRSAWLTLASFKRAHVKQDSAGCVIADIGWACDLSRGFRDAPNESVLAEIRQLLTTTFGGKADRFRRMLLTSLAFTSTNSDGLLICGERPRQ